MTVSITIPGIGHTRASTVREFGGRTELAPQSPFAGDPEFDSSDLTAWTKLNSGSATTFDAQTTRKGYLTIAPNTNSLDWQGSTRSSPVLYQSITGDFDVYARASIGPQDTGATGHTTSLAGIVCQNGADATNWVAVFNGWRPNGPLVWKETAASSTSLTITYPPAHKVDVGGLIYLRLKRASGVFSAYTGWDGVNWTQITNPASPTTFTGACNLGVTLSCDNGTTSTYQFDFIRNTLPYDTASPTSSIVLGPFGSGTIWDPSTFAPEENPYQEFEPYSQIGFGTLKYQIGAGDSSPPTLNGTWLDAAGIQALSTLTGSYLKLAVQYNSAAGYDLVRFGGAAITAALPSGAGGGLFLNPGFSGGFRG